VVEGTRLRMQEMSDSFFEAALGGENLEVILGTINMALQQLTAYFDENRDSIQQNVRSGWANLLSVIPLTMQVFNGFAALLDFAKIGFEGLKFAVESAVVTFGDFALMISQGLLRVLEQLTNGLQTTIDMMSDIAGAIPGLGGLQRTLDNVGAAVGSIGDGADDAIERINAFREDAQRGLDNFRETAQANIGAAFDRIIDRDNRLDQITDQISEYQLQIESGEMANNALRRSVGGANGALEEQRATLADLGEALARYADRMLVFLAEYKTRAREARIAELELNDFIFDAYSDYANKQIELAEMRAAAEEAAQTKIQGAIDRTTEAYDRWASGSVDAFTLAIAGQQKFADAARASIGDVVAALADEARARAIAAGATGNFGAAAALGAASVAIGAIAATLGASRGGGGGGGGGSSQPTQVNNVSVQVLGGPLGVTQDQVRQLGEVVNEAIGRGVVRA